MYLRLDSFSLLSLSEQVCSSSTSTVQSNESPKYTPKGKLWPILKESGALNQVHHDKCDCLFAEATTQLLLSKIKIKFLVIMTIKGNGYQKFRSQRLSRVTNSNYFPLLPFATSHNSELCGLIGKLEVLSQNNLSVCQKVTALKPACYKDATCNLQGGAIHLSQPLEIFSLFFSFWDSEHTLFTYFHAFFYTHED